MSFNKRTNAYRSSNSVIVSGPGTMYNEVTRPKSNTKQYNANTNTHDVTVPYIKSSNKTNTSNKRNKTRKNSRSKT